MPVLECARRAGYDVMSQRNANRIARDRRVMARVNYLAGNTDEVIREKREAYERELSRIAYANMDDFIIVNDGRPDFELESG